ncbi:MAG: hypothetical protein ACSLE8_06255 [Rhodococcus sp. (in: high G+C Gram-positive bacteria)]
MRTGVHTRSRFLLTLRRSLVDSISRQSPAEPVKKKVKKPRSPHSDETVALVRGDRELRKMKLKDIAVKRGLPVSTVAALVNYVNRPHITPL